MFFNATQITLLRVSPTALLELDVATTLAYYIIDPGNPLTIASLEYKVDKLSGRSTTQVTPWTTIDVVGVTDDTYTMEVTLPSATVSSTDSVLLTLKVVDDGGQEFYYKDSEVSPL